MREGNIDWELVLGPLATPGVGWSAAETRLLEEAAFALPRRAVRPRSESIELPFASEPVPWFPLGRFVDESQGPVRPGGYLHYLAGDYYIQDAGSMLALALCDVRPGQRVCDTCAAPGGKATALVEALQGTGWLLANETIQSRLPLLELALARTRFPNYLVTSLDVERLHRLCGSVFERVLVDAPCTGQTMVARGKQSLASFSSAQIEHSSQRQSRILRAAAGLVAPGGRLVYSTCAYSYAENEGIVDQFLREHPDWSAVEAPHLADWASPILAGCYRVWPHRAGSAGAFAAALQCQRDDADAAASPARGRDLAWKRLDGFPTEIDFLESETSSGWWQRRDALQWIAPGIPESWMASSRCGLSVARLKGSRWQPEYASALLAGGPCRASETFELCDSMAMHYAAGETLRMDFSGHPWTALHWRGRPLSWTKAVGGALKNHFPKPFRQQHLTSG